MKLIFNFVVVFLLSVCHSTLQAYPFYQLQLPNGHQVPHPCDRSVFWHGVGHWKESGTGDRNPFGQDFAAAGHKWTAELCRKDSDGDGRTNGQELGDPDCTWSLASVPAVTDIEKLSHPGICEPITSPECLEKNRLILVNEACQKAYREAGLEVKSRTTRDEDAVLTSDDSSTPLPTYAMPLPSEIVIYKGPLNEVMLREDQRSSDQFQAPSQVVLPQHAIYQTVTVSHENYTVEVQIPILGAEPIVAPPQESTPTPQTAYVEEEVPNDVQQPLQEVQQSVQVPLGPAPVQPVQPLEYASQSLPIQVPAVIPLQGETRYYQAPTIYQTNNLNDEQQQQQQQLQPQYDQIPVDTQQLYRYLFPPATYNVPAAGGQLQQLYPPVMIEPASFEPPRIAPYQWRQNGGVKTTVASSFILLLISVTTLIFQLS